MRCPKCGTDNRGSAKYCDECGFELPTVAPYAHEMFSHGVVSTGGGADITSGAEPAEPAGSAGATADSFTSLFNESGTVKLTHIAEKLRKPESSGTFVFLPEDEETEAAHAEIADPLTPGDDILIGAGTGGSLAESLLGPAEDMEYLLDDISCDTADLNGEDDAPNTFEESMGYPEDALNPTGDAMLSEDIVPEIPGEAFPYEDASDEDIYSVDTAPLLVSDVSKAIEQDDQSTMLAQAAAAAHAQRMQAQAQTQGGQHPSSTLEMPVVPVAAAGGSPKDAHSFLAFSSGKRHRFTKRFKTGFVISLCAVAALIAILGITYALQIWGGKTVPDVMGAASADAKYLLEESGFFVEEKLIVSDDVEGMVIEVWPEPGSRQPLGSTVTIGVSTFRKIPDILGMPLEEAQNLLSENGYADIELVMKKSDADEGSVLSVTPAVGTRANAETHVTIEVAQPFLVPDVVAQPQGEAVRLLEAEGFSAEIQYDYSNDIPEGCVLRTVPAAGEPCKTTTPVQVVIAVSRATELGELTSALFNGVLTVTYGGNLYKYVEGSFITVDCPDNNTINFTIRGRLLDYHTWPDGRTDTWMGGESTLSASAGWSDNNEFLYMDPNLLA